LFGTYGYRALTMRSIAKAMGYSHGALYYHFKEKADLFYELIREDFSLLLQQQRELIGREPTANLPLLKKLMIEFIRFGLDNPNHYEIMFMLNDPEFISYSRTEQAQCLEIFAMVIRDLIAGKPALEARKYTLPWHLFMSLHGFISYCIHYNQTFEEVRKTAEEHVQMLCGSLGFELLEHRRQVDSICSESA
jgi:AcrR family transcriptional regulator